MFMNIKHDIRSYTSKHEMQPTLTAQTVHCGRAWIDTPRSIQSTSDFFFKISLNHTPCTVQLKAVYFVPAFCNASKGGI